MNIKLVACDRKTGSGIYVYSNKVVNALSKLCNVDVSFIDASEFKIGNRNFGGLVKPLLKSFATRMNGYSIVHSLDMRFINPKTNVITLLDLIPFLDVNDCDMGNIRKIIYSYLVKRLKKMKRIFTISNTVADNASDLFDIDRDHFANAYCGIDHSMFHHVDLRPLEMLEDKINILYVGDLRLRKNVHLILEALSHFADRYRFIRIGPSRLSDYKNKCYSIAKKNNIEFIDLGYVPLEYLKCYYSFADLFVFPSSDEGFGMPPMEALACGTPCVLSNIPVFREIYSGAVMFSEIDKHTLAANISNALKRNWDEKSLSDFTKKFTWENTAKKMLDVYREVT